MKRIIMTALILFFLIGSMLSLGGCKGGKVDWDQIGKAVFDEVIQITILAIEAEIGETKDDHVGFIMNWMEGWMINLKGAEYLDKYIPKWRDKLKEIISNAYDVVMEFGNEILKSKLAMAEYIGADAMPCKVLGPDDFMEYYDEIMAPLN